MGFVFSDWSDLLFSSHYAAHSVLLQPPSRSLFILQKGLCMDQMILFAEFAPFSLNCSSFSTSFLYVFCCYSRILFLTLVIKILLASLFGIVLYSLIFFVLRGTVKVRRGIKLTLNPTKRWAEREKAELYHRFVMELSRSMLWYFP